MSAFKGQCDTTVLGMYFGVPVTLIQTYPSQEMLKRCVPVCKQPDDKNIRTKNVELVKTLGRRGWKENKPCP